MMNTRRARPMCRYEAMCPYKDKMCPKTADLEERIETMEARQMNMNRMLYYIVGVVTASLGVGIGGLIS